MSREPRIALPGQRDGTTLRQSSIDAARSGIEARRNADAVRLELTAMAVFALALPVIVELPDAEALELLRGIARHDVSIAIAKQEPRCVTLDFKRDGVVIGTIEVHRPLPEVPR